MDFTGMMISDQYRAIVQERERQIQNSAWRRKFEEARRDNAAACCDAIDHVSDARRAPAPRTAMDPR